MQVNTISTHTHTHTHHLPAVPVSTWDRQHYWTASAPPCDRHLHCFFEFKTGRASSYKTCGSGGTVVCAKMVLFSLTCFLCCGEAKVPAVLSPSLCHPSASPSFSPLARTTHSVPPCTDCPFSLTPATCHWKESITLSAHSERAVKRPVRAIKALRVKSSFTQQNLKRTLL